MKRRGYGFFAALTLATLLCGGCGTTEKSDRASDWSRDMVTGENTAHTGEVRTDTKTETNKKTDLKTDLEQDGSTVKNKMENAWEDVKDGVKDTADDLSGKAKTNDKM